MGLSLWVEAVSPLRDAAPSLLLVGVPVRLLAATKPFTIIVALQHSALSGVLLFTKILVVTDPREPSLLSWSKMTWSHCGCALEDQHVSPVLPCHISHVIVDVKVAGMVEYDLA